MKNYFLLLFLIISVCANNSVFSQDIIKTKTGDEIKAKLLKTTRKEATYKSYNDPEFSTYTMPYKELASIKKEGSKREVLFNHNLPRAYISFSLGPAFAIGNLKSTSFSNSKGESGFAQSPGFNARIEAAVYIYKKLGLTATLGGFGYKFDYSRYGSAYGEFYNASQQNSGYYNNNNNNHYKSKGNWQFSYLMIGPIYSVKLIKRITWDFKARLGLVGTQSPDITLSYYNSTIPGSSFYYIVDSKYTSNLGYNFGTSFRVALSRRLALFLSADYYSTHPQLSGSTHTQYPPGSSLYPTGADQAGGYSTKYKFSSINTSIGLAYQFKRKGNKYE